ncbi:MAG: chemotaxis response regulator protein-glutamate methylesterase [Rhodospirillales bacterium]|nr:chemotaxis response regulator protein-glutamate methylesterase [Rhodospirillales bacterium]
MPPPRPQAPKAGNESPIRVLIVDDSAVVRGLLSRLVAEQPDLEVAATAANGQMALNMLAERRVDVVVLDIEMPVMDGLTALPQLLAADPHLRIIIASTLSTPGAAVTMRALAAGASDYVAKPSASREITQAGCANSDFRRDLLTKIRGLGEAGRRRRGVVALPTAAPQAGATRPGAPIVLRPLRGERPGVIVIGSSTGGPQALSTLIGGLGSDVAQPMLIVQHMPPTFTTILAEHLARLSGRPCAEGRDGEVIQPGRIYVAPGDHHMLVAADGRRRLIRINREAPENFCRPAVDVLFRSAARAFGAGTLAVVLTGIGADGTRGGRDIVDAEGALLAQDEATSIVWGMPGSVARAGLCSAVLPLPALARQISQIAGGARS